MKAFKLLFLTCLSSLAIASQPVKIKDQYYQYQLEENTSMVLYLAPDLKTRLIFPFALDNQALKPDVKHSITPQDVFSVSSVQGNDGQNTIELWNAQTPSTVASLMDGYGFYPETIGIYTLSVGGYNLSIRLKTTNDLSKHLENIVFDLAEDDRRHLIDLEINRYKDDIDKQYQQKLADLDESAKGYGAEYVAQVLAAKPKISRIKLDMFSAEKDFSLYIDSVEKYDEDYFALRFEIGNLTGDNLVVDNIEHIGVFSSKEMPFEGADNCKVRMERKEVLRCVFVTDDSQLMKVKHVKTIVSTSVGRFEFEW